MALHETITRPSFRLARAGDARAVLALQQAVAVKLKADFGEGHWTSSRTLKTIKKHIEQDHIHLTEIDSETCGTFRLDQTKIGFYQKAWFANPDDPALYLTDMAIDPTHQRQGLGRATMHEIERIARDKDCKAVRFDAYDAAAGAAPFYEKCGYAEVHRGPVGATKLIYFEKVLG